jgi:signal transduction histidine kinase
LGVQLSERPGDCAEPYGKCGAERLVRRHAAFYAGGVRRGAGAAALVTAVVSAVAIVAVALLPQLHFAYPAPALHVALETSSSLIALLAGFLVLGRLRRAGRLDELLLACGLALLALLNLFLLTVPALVGLVPQDLGPWATLVGSALGAALFALAAFVPRRRLRRPGLVAGWAASVATAVLVAVFLVSEFADRSPRTAAPELEEWADLHARLTVLALQLLMTLLYGAAAVGFVRRSRRLGDEFPGWLASAAVLAAASHVCYYLYPLRYSQWVQMGDVFRLCSYAVLLAGSMREIWSYWHALSQAAVAEERRRIARDLHDGLAQELAYLARNLDSLGGQTGDHALERLRRAVGRAQLESRRAVGMLAAPAGQAIEAALGDAVGEIAERFHVGLDLELASGLRLSAARAEALIRIACEAVTNSARHSGASQVRLNVERDGPRVRLRVSDQGRGFDTAVPCGGFGLVSMGERARSVGGELRISSAPGQGSEVEAAL